MPDPVDPAQQPSDAILTVPNVITIVRLLTIPVVIWLALGPGQFGWAFGLAAFGFATDLVDGRVARRYGQVTKLGIAMDPLADRLGVAAGAWIFLATDLVPLWAVIAVVARDALLVLIGAPVLKLRDIPIPAVSDLGKKASFAVSVCFALFLASAIPGTSPPSRVLQDAAWVFFWIGVPLYYVAAAGYVRAGFSSMARTGPDRSAR